MGSQENRQIGRKGPPSCVPHPSLSQKPCSDSSGPGTLALLDFPLFSPCMPTIIFIPEIYEFHFFQSLQWVEQKSSKTKMAVAEAAKVQLDVCFVQLDFYLKPHPRPEAQNRICELILGSVWKVSYQHLMAFQGFLCSEAAIVILN